jgi:hypothetical protein
MGNRWRALGAALLRSVARGAAESSQDDDPQFDKAAANNFALLKDRLHQAAETCSDDYRTRILGIYGSAAH